MMGKHLDLDGMWQRTFGMYWGTCDYPISPYQGFNSFCLNSHPQQRRRNQDRGVEMGYFSPDPKQPSLKHLQESLFLGNFQSNYTLPREWFNKKCGLTLGFVAKNLWMIYCKAPFDPEMTTAASSNYYQGFDSYMLPSTRSLGFNVRLQF